MNQSRFLAVVFIAVLFISYTTGYGIKVNPHEIKGKTINEKATIRESENLSLNDHSKDELPQTQPEEYPGPGFPPLNNSQLINNMSQLQKVFVEPFFEIREIHPEHRLGGSMDVEMPYIQSSVIDQMDHYIENMTSQFFYSTDIDSTENLTMVELVPGSGFKVNKSLIVEMEQDFQSIKENLQQHLLKEFQNPDIIASLMLLSKGGAPKSVEDVSDSVKEYVNKQLDESYTVFVDGLLDHILPRQNEIRTTTTAATTTTTTATTTTAAKKKVNNIGSNLINQ